MSGSVNKVTLIGNLGRDPEVRTTASGDKIVSLRLATSDSWRDRNSGERRERVEWHNVVIFNDKLGEIAEQYLRKGSKVYVEGSLQTRTFESQGAERTVTEVVLQKFRGELTLLGGEPQEAAPARAAAPARRPPAQPPQRPPARRAAPPAREPEYEEAAGFEELDDEIPF